MSSFEQEDDEDDEDDADEDDEEDEGGGSDSFDRLDAGSDPDGSLEGIISTVDGGAGAAGSSFFT